VPAVAEGNTRLGRRQVALLVSSLYLLLAVGLFAKAWGNPLHRWVGAPEDAPIFIWAMRWWPFAVSHGYNPFFTHFLGLPRGINLMWATSVPFLSFLLVPLTITCGAVLSYNVAMTIAVAGSASAAYLALRGTRVVRDRRAAFVGGLVYGFSPYVIAHSLGHLAFTSVYLLPLAAVLVVEAAVVQRRPAWMTGIALGALGAVQLYIGQEVLGITALTLAIGLACLAATHARQIRARSAHALRVGLVAMVAFVVCAGPALVYELGASQRIHGPVQPTDTFVADLTATVVPTPLQWYRPFDALRVSSRFKAGGGEYNAFLGVPLVAVIVGLVIVERRRRAIIAAALALATLSLLALGPHLQIDGRRTTVPLPWAAVAHVPLVQNVLPVRLMLGADLIAAGLLAVALDRLLASHRRAAQGVAAAVVVSVVVTLWPSLPFPSTLSATPPFFRTGAVRAIPAGSVALVAPYAEPATSQVLVWQADANFRYRMLGATFPVPDRRGRAEFVGDDNAAWRVIRLLELGQRPDPTDPTLRRQLLALFRADRIDSVLVGPMVHEDRAVAFFATLLGRPPVQQGDVSRWTGVLASLSAA
jgi:hypothetical protein